MCDPETSILRLFPILGRAVPIGVWRNHLPPHLHGLDVEEVVVTYCKKPDIFRTVLPIGLCPTPFLTFPGNSVLRDEILFTNLLDCRGAAPVAANVNRGCWLEYYDSLRQPRIQPFGVFVERALPEFPLVESLGEVVRRIGEH